MAPPGGRVSGLPRTGRRASPDHPGREKFDGDMGARPLAGGAPQEKPMVIPEPVNRRIVQ